MKYSGFFDTDPIGRVFFWKGKLFREIKTGQEGRILTLFKRGLIDHLSKNQLIPDTKLTNFKTRDSNLVISHQLIEYTSYPYEWSFEMFKEAAVCVLKVNREAQKFGFQTKDAHAYNILFDFSKPKFIDLGSFIKLEKSKGWVSCEEYLRNFYYPLKLASMGMDYLSFLSRSSSTKLLSHEEYMIVRYPLLRFFSKRILATIMQLIHSYRRLSAVPDGYFNTSDRRVKKIALFLKLKKLLFFQKFDYAKHIEEIKNLQHNKHSRWGRYQKTTARHQRSARFNYPLSLLEKYKIQSACDLGGNQGLFSRLMIKHAKVKRVVCVDNDEVALDICYLNAQNQKLPLLPIFQNFVSLHSNYGDKLLFERVKSDAVVALAITHHLILGQRYPIDLVLSSIGKYSTKYIFVEFMPLGLYYNQYSPAPPAWYNEEWFITHFKKYFKLLHKKRVSKNRVLFVGSLKNHTPK